MSTRHEMMDVVHRVRNPDGRIIRQETERTKVFYDHGSPYIIRGFKRIYLDEDTYDTTLKEFFTFGGVELQNL